MRRPDYGVASDGRQRLPGGRIAGTVVSPVGTIHALEAGSERVVCGRSAAGLYEFPEVDFMAVRGPGRCSECSTLLQPPVPAGSDA